MTRPPSSREPLVRALELQKIELEVQNHELSAINKELQESNTALEAARDRYQALYELAPAPLVTLSRQGVVLDINAAGLALLRAPREHVLDRRLGLFVAEKERRAFHELLERAFAAGHARGEEVALAFDDDARVTVVLDGVVVREDGADRALLTLTDRTVLQQASERARLEGLRVLAAGVAHTFSNLLTIVLAGADHAARLTPPESAAAEPLDEVLQAARKASALAHQMMAYSGQASAAPRVIDIGDLVRAIAAVIDKTPGATPLAVDLPPSLPRLLADEGQIRQVLVNLVLNATEAMDGRAGAVRVSVRAEHLSPAWIARLPWSGEIAPGPFVVVAIHDDGAGMDARTRARVFEPYFTTKLAGRGLGLAVVDGVVRAHQGALTIDSEIDEGTTVRLYLPAVALPAAPVAERPDRPLRGAGRILVIDDDPDVLRMLGRVIRSLGFDAVTATSGAEALEIFRAEHDRIDLVLTDFTMPAMNGLAVAAEIRRVRADVPIALVTGWGDIPGHARAAFSDVIAKPFVLEELAALLRRLLPGPAG